jgi:hypothetical protein
LHHRDRRERQHEPAQLRHGSLSLAFGGAVFSNT